MCLFACTLLINDIIFFILLLFGFHKFLDISFTIVDCINMYSLFTERTPSSPTKTGTPATPCYEVTAVSIAEWRGGGAQNRRFLSLNRIQCSYCRYLGVLYYLEKYRLYSYGRKFNQCIFNRNRCI